MGRGRVPRKFYCPECFVERYTITQRDRKSTRLNSSHGYISYAVFCLKKKTIRHQLTIPSITEALDEEKSLNMLGTFVKNWFRYESHFVHAIDSLVYILKERVLLSESDAVQPLIGNKS